MNRYLFNSAVVTEPGIYQYELIDRIEAIKWMKRAPYLSTIRYPDTREALEIVTEMDVPLNDLVVSMRPGDEALVFRLKFPSGTKRVQGSLKGQFNSAWIIRHSEIGILKRIS